MYLAQACQKNNCALIYISSDQVFSGLHAPYDENQLPHPINWYGISKLWGEKAARINQNTCVVRTNFLSTEGGFFQWVKTNLEAGKTIQGYTDIFFNPLDADFLSDCLQHLINLHNRPQLLHLSARDCISKGACIQKIAQLMGKENQVELCSAPIDYQKAKRPKNMSLRSSIIAQLTSFPPMPSMNEVMGRLLA